MRARARGRPAGRAQRADAGGGVHGASGGRRGGSLCFFSLFYSTRESLGCEPLAVPFAGGGQRLRAGGSSPQDKNMCSCVFQSLWEGAWHALRVVSARRPICQRGAGRPHGKHPPLIGLSLGPATGALVCALADRTPRPRRARAAGAAPTPHSCGDLPVPRQGPEPLRPRANPPPPSLLTDERRVAVGRPLWSCPVGGMGHVGDGARGLLSQRAAACTSPQGSAPTYSTVGTGSTSTVATTSAVLLPRSWVAAVAPRRRAAVWHMVRTATGGGDGDQGGGEERAGDDRRSPRCS